MAINKNKVMEAAQKFVEKGQTDKAIKEYLKVVQEDPKDVRVWLKIGDLYAKKGAKPEATETYLKVAQFYGEQGFYLKAVAVYKQILKIDPRLIDVNLKLAEVYRQLGLLSDAMQQYELVAAFYHREGKTREALATIKDLVELDPENVATRIKLAELYSKEGMAKEAIAEFAKAADYLRGHNRMDDFIKVAERLVWHQPDNHAMNRELATLYLRRQDPRRALQKLQACFKADPRDVETLALLASAFQALDQKPKTVSVWKELARIHQENGAQREAQDVYRKILTLAPDDADALAALGGAARRGPAGTGGFASIPSMPAQPPPAVATPIATPPPPQAQGGSAFPRVATPITGAPVGRGVQPTPDRRSQEVQRLAEPIAPPPHTRQSGEVPAMRRPTGSFPLVEDPFPEGGGGEGSRFDLDDEAPSQRTSPRPTGDTTSRRGASDDDVELEVEDLGGGGDEMILGAGADPAEAHADEIVKILTETDVYTKYGLHQKAIEHLKRIFDLDPRNVEAREKLKDIFVALGRNAEAATELARLVELTAGTSPDQATGYLRELTAIDPNDSRGRALAARFHLDAGPSVEVQVDSGLAVSAADIGSGLAVEAEAQPEEVGVDFDEVAIEPATPPPTAADELPEVALDAASVDDGAMEFEFDDVGGGASAETPAPEPRREATQQVAEDQVDAELSLDSFDGGELEFEENLGASPQTSFDGDLNPQTTEAAPDFDPVPGPTPALRNATRRPESDEATFDGDYDDLAAPPPGGMDEFSLDPGDDAVVESMSAEAEAASSPAAAEEAAPASGNLEDELDEADFFVSQDLYAEARGILTELLGRYPNHPLVVAKLQDVEAMENAAQGSPPGAPLPAVPVVETPAPAPTRSVTPAKAATPAPKRPTVIAKPLGEEDAATHHDLGMAYREMGLYDEAIKEFSLVRDTPGRAVQCCHMIGLCHVDRGQYSEAVAEFKNGLYVDGITDRESLALYYELGAAYEALGDAREALYYYEKVSKRDPRFRDVDKRVAAVKAAQGANGNKGGGGAGSSTVDEAEAAIDAISNDDFTPG